MYLRWTKRIRIESSGTIEVKSGDLLPLKDEILKSLKITSWDESGKKGTVEDEFKMVTPEDICQFMMRLVKRSPKADLIYEGTVFEWGCSTNYNFKFEYKNYELTGALSYWYEEFYWQNTDEDYELFCERFDGLSPKHRYTREEFKNFTENDTCYIWGNKVVTEVPYNTTIAINELETDYPTEVQILF